MAHLPHSPWYYYSRALDDYKEQLDQLDYVGVAPKLPKPRLRTQGFYSVLGLDDLLTSDSIKSLLSESSLGPPHGFDLLKPLPLPSFPKFPERPETFPPIQKPGLGFSIFGSPWRPPKHEVDPETIVKEESLREQTSTLCQKSRAKVPNCQISTRYIAD